MIDPASEDTHDTGDTFIFEDAKVLQPALDFHDDVLYVTLPIMKSTTVTEGRGKAAQQVRKKVEATMVVTSERDYFEYTPDELAARGFAFPQTFTRAAGSSWPLPDVKAYLAGEAPIINGHALFDELRDIFRSHVEYAEEIHYDLVPLFVMQSYLFRLFKATGYLHFNGTKASGKSQNLRLIKAFAFNTVWASSMSESALFRRTAGWPGVVCVDEAESFEGEKGQALRLILNAGYLASTTATRAEKVAEHFETKEYLLYSPKVLASINPLEPVIASRCVIVHMAPALRAIPEFDPDHPKWAAVRSKLYLWAMQQAKSLSALALDWNERKRYVEASQLVNRPWQIVQSYIVVADHLGGRELVAPLVEFFNKYFEQVNRSEEETDRQRLLLKCLPRVLFAKEAKTIEGEHGWFALKDIHEVFVDHIDEDVREYYKTRQTSRHLKSLGWDRRKQAHGGTMVHLPEDDIRAQFKRRRVSPFEEDLPWLEGERTYIDPPTPTLFDTPAPETAPTNDVDDQYSWVDELNDGPVS